MLVVVLNFEKRRTSTQCAFTFSGGAIANKSETQTMTALSSTEAEFIAAFAATKATWCPTSILQELGHPLNGPAETHIGNQAASNDQ